MSNKEYKFGNRSKRMLVGINPILAFAATEAIKLTEQDFMVFEGLRTKEKQRKYIARGVSWTMKSHHLTGNAIDLVAYNGKPDWSNIDDYKKIKKAMDEVIQKYDLPISHGYDLWKTDWPHWQLDRKARKDYDINLFAREAFNLI